MKMDMCSASEKKYKQGSGPLSNPLVEGPGSESETLYKYQWPASRLSSREMAILTSWREKTGLPITECLRQAVEVMDRIISTGKLHSEVVR